MNFCSGIEFCSGINSSVLGSIFVAGNIVVLYQVIDSCIHFQIFVLDYRFLYCRYGPPYYSLKKFYISRNE